MWQPIETAPKAGYIVVGTQIAVGKWIFNYVFCENDEWVDVSSNHIVRPDVWCPEPPEQATSYNQ